VTVSWKPGDLLQVETGRFVLRSLTRQDASDSYVGWWNDAEIQEGLNFPPRGWGRRRAMQHIDQFDNVNKFHLGIFCKDSARMIGFFAIFVNPKNKVAVTNVVIGDKDFWGKGVVQEVRAAMLVFLFRVLGMEKVKGEIKGRNYPSIFNYKAQGFTCEGILRNEISHVSGGRADVFLFGLLRAEWESQQATTEAGEGR
jgi:RimJ/RimL family protein N-acetyltransferase